MSDDTKQKTNWLIVGLLAVAAPVAGLWYWLSRPDASSQIETSVQVVSSSLDQALLSMVAEKSDEQEDDEDRALMFWQTFGDAKSPVTSKTPNSGGDEGNGPSGNAEGENGRDDEDDNELLSLADAEALIANARVLSRLPSEALRPELAGDSRVRQLLQSAQEIIERRGVPVDRDLLAGQAVDELSRAEQVSIARAAESQIAEVACRFELAAVDQTLESLTRSEAHFRVIQKDLKTVLPADSLMPEDAFALAPKETLLKSSNALQSHRLQLKRKLAILGVGSDSIDFEAGKIYSLIDRFITRIQGIVESDGYSKFQAERLAEYKNISKTKWDESVKGQPERIAKEEASRLKILHAEAGWPELRIASTGIRGPPAGTIDSVVWTSIREFDTNVRRWLKAESCVRALGDELLTFPEVRELIPQLTDSRYERVAVLLEESTLRKGLMLANSVVSQITNVVEQEVFPGRREHFAEIQNAFRKEIKRRQEGGRALASNTGELSSLVKKYTNTEKPPARAEARMLSLSARRFPQLDLVPTNIRSDIKDVQAKAIGRYADRITTLIGGYQEVANHLALATEPAPELLEKLQGARAELQAINTEFSEMVEVAKKYGTEVASTKAVLVQLEGLFPRGPPEDNPPPTAQPRPDKPRPSGGGGNGMMVDASDVKRVLSDKTPTTATNPSLEKYLVLSSARLSNVEAIVRTTLPEASSLDALPVKFATALGRRVYNPLKVSLKGSGEPDFRSIAADQTKTRLSESLKDWEGRLKEDPLSGKKVPFDHRTEVKNPKSFKAVGGGIHFGEVATSESEIPKQVFALRYESGSLFLHDGRDGERYIITSPKEIDATSLKALLRFANANRNAAISIGWAMEKPSVLERLDSEESDPGSAILLDPFLVDTAVGQDLILADSIPWKFGEEKLPNGQPISFHEEFEAEYDSFREQRVATVAKLFKSVEPFKNEDRADWLAQMERADAPLVIQILLRDETGDAARQFFVNRSVREILKADGTTTGDRSALRKLREVIVGKVLEANDVSSLDLLNEEGKRLVNRLATERVEEIKTEISKDFDDRVLPLIEGDSAEEELLPMVDLTMSAMLAAKKCPTVLVQLWASLLMAKESEAPITSDMLASAFVARLNATTLAVLYDDNASFKVADKSVSLTVSMKYRYATSLVDIASDEVTIGSPQDPGREIETIESLTDIANDNLDVVVGSYPPLERVVRHAAIEAFLKWAIAARRKGSLLIDLSELAAVPSHDPENTPTPDRILK